MVIRNHRVKNIENEGNEFSNSPEHIWLEKSNHRFLIIVEWIVARFPNKKTYPLGYLVNFSVNIVIALTLQSLSAKNCSISFLSALKCTFLTKTLRLSRSSSGLALWAAPESGAADFVWDSSAPSVAGFSSGIGSAASLDSIFFSLLVVPSVYPTWASKA